MSSGAPRCHRVDCFANEIGRCVALRTAKFKGDKDCPFFKTKEQLNKELLEIKLKKIESEEDEDEQVDDYR